MKVESKIHKKFKLQGNSFNSVDELVGFSKNNSVEVYNFLDLWFNNDKFIIVNTSGSTGKPKQIQLQKEHMINSAKATGTFFNLFEDTTALLCMSPEFIAGKMMLVRALTLGWHLDVVLPSSKPLKSIKKSYDFCAMVPIQLSNSINDLSRIRKLIVGGGVVSKEILQKIQGLKTEIFATYGMTETITHIAIKKLNNFSHSELDSESHYYVLPNVSISKDERGCLVINAPKITKETVITNDLIKLISDTEFEWLGRFDTIINSGGIKLIPEQIEKKISEIISERFFVTGIQDAVLGEKLVLIVEDEATKLGGSIEDKMGNVISTTLNHENNLMQKLKQLKSLSKYELPKKIYYLKAFIETETQKINRAKTLDLLVIK